MQLNTSLAQKSLNSKVLTKSLQIIDTPKAAPHIATINTSTDSSLLKNKKIVTTIDTLNISKDSLDAPVKYKAQDSGVLILSTREFFLYGKSNVQYTTINLDANVIKYDGTKQTVRAYGAMDTTKNPLNRTKMQDGSSTTYSDTIDYNFKTQKGRTVNSYYTEGELFVNAQILKKIDSNVFYGYKGRFTTCNLDTPHFAFRTRKLKMISNKIAVSGPAFPEFEGVPIPIGIPFGIYPLSKGRHSGILAPQFVSSEDMGIGLQGMGYYKVLNDNFDALIKGDLYAYGGWTMNITSKYIVRYKYAGNFNLTIINNKRLNRDATINQELIQDKNFQLLWSHQVDGKARPGTSFGANVNFSSTQFNKYNIGNTISNYNNQTGSSVSYSKNYNQKANLSLSFVHNQNATTRLVNLQLPAVAFSMQTVYPFQKKEQVGKTKWYQNVGIGYSNTFNNNISFYDSAVTFAKFIDTMRWHAAHQIPISLALPPLGPFTISPSVSYSEEWYDRSYDYTWNDATKKVDSSYNKAFLRDIHTGFGLSLNTRIFGMYVFKHSKSIKAIRHEIRPSVGFSYTPNLASRNNYSLQIDTFKHVATISKFTGSQVYNQQAHGSLSFNLNNSVEMKIKDKKDTAATATKKIQLFTFDVSTNYNLAVDSFALSPFNLRFSSNALQKVNFSATGTLDPYVYDSTGYRTPKLAWQKNGFSLGRLSTITISMSTQLKSKAIDDKKSSKTNTHNDPFMTADEQQRQLEYARSNPAEFTDFNIPWSVNLNYSLSFSSVFNRTIKAFEYTKYSSMSFTGDFNLSPKWKLGANGNYNVTNAKLENLNFFISREMHCWQLSINVTPINIWRSFSFTISPKSGMLRDLKINRTRQFSNQ